MARTARLVLVQRRVCRFFKFGTLDGAVHHITIIAKLVH